MITPLLNTQMNKMKKLLILLTFGWLTVNAQSTPVEINKSKIINLETTSIYWINDSTIGSDSIYKLRDKYWDLRLSMTDSQEVYVTYIHVFKVDKSRIYFNNVPAWQYVKPENLEYEYHLHSIRAYKMWHKDNPQKFYFYKEFSDLPIPKNQIIHVFYPYE